MILQGGWAMIPLGLMSTAMVYFIVQNALALREKVLLRPDLLPEFVSLMKDKKIVEAHTKCKENETLFICFSSGFRALFDKSRNKLWES